MFSLASMFHWAAFLRGGAECCCLLPAHSSDYVYHRSFPFKSQNLSINTAFFHHTFHPHFIASYHLGYLKVSFHDTNIMSAVVHHLVSRGIDATRQGWTAQSTEEPEVTVFNMPTWGFVTLWLTTLLWVGVMFAVSIIH